MPVTCVCTSTTLYGITEPIPDITIGTSATWTFSATTDTAGAGGCVCGLGLPPWTCVPRRHATAHGGGTETDNHDAFVHALDPLVRHFGLSCSPIPEIGALSESSAGGERVTIGDAVHQRPRTVSVGLPIWRRPPMTRSVRMIVATGEASQVQKQTRR